MAPDSSAAVSTRDAAVASDTDRAPKWTVMVFMGADTIEGNEPLDDAANADLAEIASIGGASTLDVHVQIHRSTAPTRRYFFGVLNGHKTVHEETVRATAPETALIDFVDASIRKSKHRPGDHSMLVLWGHAYDFAFARARTRNGFVDAIDFVELSGMLQRLQDRVEEWSGQPGDPRRKHPVLDIVGFDACDVSTVEMACQLQPFVTFLLGSEIGIPIPGWPYDRILDRLSRPYGKLMTPAEFGSYVVRRFCESYPASTPVSLTFLNLREATQLRKRAEALAMALSASIDSSAYRDRIVELFRRSQTGEDRPFVDVVDLCLNLRREGGDPLVSEVARALGDLLLSPRGAVVGNSGTGQGRPLILDHGRNAGELARLNGISLYAPHVASGESEAARTVYEQFVFARGTLWSELVHLLVKYS